MSSVFCSPVGRLELAQENVQTPGHEVPGKAPPQRYGVTRAGVRIDSMIGIRVGVSQVQETVRYIEQQLEHHRTRTFQEENFGFA
jgi:hypothetical protein